jgi:hypothetical protein
MPMHRPQRAAVISGTVVALVLVLVLLALGRQGPTSEAVAAPTVVTTVPTTAAPDTTTTTPPPPDTTPPEPEAPGAPVPHPAGPRFPTFVATASKPTVAVTDAPDGRFVVALNSPLPFSRMPVNFQVLDDPGTGWLHVALRTRPNGSTGWIRAADVAVTTHDWSIDVDLTAHWITVYKGGEVWLENPVVTGTPATPTPIGDFFTAEGVWETNKWGAHGPFTYGLSAHSEVFMTFDGGDGQIGIHGTNAPQLRGTSSSNGCIRLSNDDITRMAQNLPMGVPVHIHA